MANGQEGSKFDNRGMGAGFILSANDQAGSKFDNRGMGTGVVSLSGGVVVTPRLRTLMGVGL